MSGPPRIGLLVRTLGTSGGTERFVHGLAGHLRDHGFPVTAWVVDVAQEVEGVEVRRLVVPARGRAGKLRALARAAEHIPTDAQDLLLGFVRAGAPDLYRAGGGSHRAWMARLGRPAWDLLGRQGDAVEAALDDRVLARARLVVANSELARRDLVDFSGVDPARIALVRNGVDLERFRPRAVPRLHPGPAALFLGNGWARKNLDAVLRALVGLPDLRLAVGGVERSPGRWQRLARRLRVQDRVTWLGPVARPELLLPAFDLYVLPTRYDPCANTCMEAMACGVAVVTTATNGAGEVLPEPWLVIPAPDDVPALQEAMARALQTPDLGARCRARAEALPDRLAYAELTRLSLALLPGAR
ncbi:glycosyltransferase family 4 protein [Myxococcota bacterium]|nr:glycosyltransferase family 4 protein [Myxococcota bacterium]